MKKRGFDTLAIHEGHAGFQPDVSSDLPIRSLPLRRYARRGSFFLFEFLYLVFILKSFRSVKSST